MSDVMATLSAAPLALSGHDRCDRCGSQAFVRVVLPAGDLLFCRHHARLHDTVLRTVAVTIEDAPEIDATPASA